MADREYIGNTPFFYDKTKRPQQIITRVAAGLRRTLGAEAGRALLFFRHRGFIGRRLRGRPYSIPELV